MSINTSAIVIVIVVAFAFFLIYSHNSQPKFYPPPHQPIQGPPVVAPNTSAAPSVSHFQPGLDGTASEHACPHCQDRLKGGAAYSDHAHQPYPSQATYPYPPQQSSQAVYPMYAPQPPAPPTQTTTKIMIENENDPYADPIKKQDAYAMQDFLTYPQMRLPREVLDKYNEYYERTGSYPPFNQSTQPLFDNPMLNGYLTKQVNEDEPFNDNIPGIIPLFRVKSSKNTNRFFYYIVDQRYNSKLELKIPLDNIRLNGIRHQNADFYGVPEIYDGDILENIPSYPGAKFRVTLYKTYHFP